MHRSRIGRAGRAAWPLFVTPASEDPARIDISPAVDQADEDSNARGRRYARASPIEERSAEHRKAISISTSSFAQLVELVPHTFQIAAARQAGSPNRCHPKVDYRRPACSCRRRTRWPANGLANALSYAPPRVRRLDRDESTPRRDIGPSRSARRTYVTCRRAPPTTS